MSLRLPFSRSVPAGLFLFLCFLAVPAAAQFQVFTDRALFEANLAGVIVEDLESEPGLPGSARSTPFTTVGGWGFDTASGSGTVQIGDPGLINGTREFHCWDFGNGLDITLPTNQLHHAFGFDFAELSPEDWRVEILGLTVYSIPDATIGFVGIISDSGPISGFRLTGTGGAAQGGMKIDDLTTGSPDCPMDLPPHDRTIGFGSRGFWFTAPAALTLVGASAPIELGSDPQSVQIIQIDAEPQDFQFPSLSSEFTTLRYDQQVAGGQVIHFNPPLFVPKGTRIGVFGGTTQNGTSTRTSYSDYLPGPHLGSIGELDVSFFRLASNQSVTSGQVSTVFYSPWSELGRFNLFVQDCNLLDGCTCSMAWRSRNASGVSFRDGAAMVYDDARGEILLFGGRAGTTFFQDTWRFDGTGWTQIVPPGLLPPARAFHGMAFDSSRQVAVLYGGSNTNGRLDDTWEWNGTQWTQTVVGGAGGFNQLGMSYDPVNQVVVRYGGDSGAGRTNSTHEYDGIAWTTTANGSPGFRSSHAMAWDPGLQQTIMFGGRLPGGVEQDDTWAYDAATNSWTNLGIVGPADRADMAMTTDLDCNSIVLYGGRDDNQTFADTWRFENGVWSDLNRTIPDATLAPRSYSAIAYDPMNAETLVVGGRGSNGGVQPFSFGFGCNDGVVANGGFGGINYLGLGQSVVSPFGNSGVVISNIGSSGQDGVAALYGESMGFTSCFDAPFGEVFAKKSEVFNEVSNTSNDVEDAQFVTFQGTGGGSSWSLGMDFSTIGATGYTAEVHDDNGLVYAESGLPNGSELVQFPSAIGKMSTRIENGEFNKYVSPPDTLPGDLTVTVNGTPVQGNLVVFKPDNSTVPTEFLIGNYLTTTSPAALYIAEASIDIDTGGDTVTASGFNGALLSGLNGGSALSIDVPSNISPVLQTAGAKLAWAPEGGCDDGISVNWQPLTGAAQPPTGDKLRFEAEGRVGGVSGTQLGYLDVQLTNDTGNLLLDYTADYSDVGSATQRIQVFDGGAMVAEYVGHAGSFQVEVDELPGGCDKERVILDGDNTACFRTTWPSSRSLTLSGIAGTKRAVTLTGDEIAVLAESPAGQLEALESFSVAASEGVGSLVLNDVSGTAAPTATPSTPDLVLEMAKPFPNPFNPSVEIRFVNPRPGPVSVTVYNVAGRRVKTLLASPELASGSHVLQWHGRDERGASVASGTYMFRLKAGAETRVVKGVLIK